MPRYSPPPLQSLEFPRTAERDPRLEAAREAGYREGISFGETNGYSAGFSDGQAKAAASFQPQLEELRSALREATAGNDLMAALAELSAARARDREEIDANMRLAVAEALEVLFPVLMQTYNGRELATLIADTLCVRTSSRLSIHAHADTIDAIVAYGLPASPDSQIVLMPDPKVPAGAVRVVWEGGGLAFDPPALLCNVTEIFLPNNMRKDVENV